MVVCSYDSADDENLQTQKVASEELAGDCVAHELHVDGTTAFREEEKEQQQQRSRLRGHVYILRENEKLFGGCALRCHSEQK